MPKNTVAKIDEWLHRSSSVLWFENYHKDAMTKYHSAESASRRLATQQGETPPEQPSAETRSGSATPRPAISYPAESVPPPQPRVVTPRGNGDAIPEEPEGRSFAILREGEDDSLQIVSTQSGLEYEGSPSGGQVRVGTVEIPPLSLQGGPIPST